MAETLNTNSPGETKSCLPYADWKKDSAPLANSDGHHVTLDVTNLSLLATAVASDIDFATGPRTPVKLTLSRKGLQRGGDRRATDSAATIAAGTEKSTLLGHVSDDEEKGTLRFATPTAAGVAGGAGRCRRIVFRRSAPWLDPRRVMVFFATLSSVGTLILLYFTLFMGSIPSNDSNAQ